MKTESIEALESIFSSAGAVVVTHCRGLSVAEISDLRHRLRNEGATFKVLKNRLAQKALTNLSLNGSEMFKGPVGIAYAPDAVTAPKIASQFAKDNKKLTIVGGLMDGVVLDANRVDVLASLPSLDQLRSMLIGLIGMRKTQLAL